MESFARISAGASSKSQQADSRDQEEQSQVGIRVDGYWTFHVSQYQQNAWRFVRCFLVNGTQLTPLGTAILLSLSTGSDAFALAVLLFPILPAPAFAPF